MATTRILDSDHALLQTLAAQTGKQQQEIIHEALESYHRERLLDEINAAFAQLKADPVAWREEQAERMAWDATAHSGSALDHANE
ncbi:hypothetical protein [Gemmatimonas sp.]|uniref:hypothetical protein n=1 Tax=Gemmatimonas sp. TaxID=1962908 RepID=UPI00286CAFA3|nr:hypothetical protein [Gemmatimonas sp.]